MTGSLTAVAPGGMLLAGTSYENSTAHTEGQYEMMVASSVIAMLALFAGKLYSVQCDLQRYMAQVSQR